MSTDQAPVAAAITDFAQAMTLLTRIPVPLPDPPPASDPAPGQQSQRIVWAFPLAGVVVAVGAFSPAWIAGWWGLPPGGVAFVALAVAIVLTGAMHEDGLADVADGFWGGWTRARRLEIMKDSRVGTYGVLALVLSVLARWWTLSQLSTAGELAAGLIAVAMLSRASMGVTMAWLPNARDSGLAHSYRRAGLRPAEVGVALAVIGAILLLGWGALAAVFWAVIAAGAVALVARAKIGGQTGDVLGCQQQIVEITVLLVLVAGL